jgi:hypothetical protein
MDTCWNCDKEVHEMDPEATFVPRMGGTYWARVCSDECAGEWLENGGDE